MTVVQNRIIPILVGMAAVIMLDHNLGILDDDLFQRLITKKYVRIVALFGAAYGANGGLPRPALVTLVAYLFFQSNMLENIKLVEDFFKSQDDNDDKNDDDDKSDTNL